MTQRILWHLALLCLTSAGFAGELVLKDKVHLSSPFVRLSQLVLDTQLSDLYHEVFLGKTPETEQPRLIPLDYIEKRLRRDGFLAVKVSTSSGQGWVELKKLAPAQKQPLLSSDLSPKPPERKLQQPIPKAEQKVFYYLKTKSDLRRGTLLTPDLFEKSAETRFIEEAFVEPEDVIGYRLERSLSQGSILNRRHTSIPPTIERGATVKVILRQPGIEITGVAKSIGEGKVGDTIEVRRGSETLSGTIIDPHTVLIQ